MNKRIKELAEQVGFKSDHLSAVNQAQQNRKIELLAELIVQECASVAFRFSMENKRFHPDFNPQNMTASHRLVYHSTCQAIGIEIKEHFGIEK